MPHCPLKSQLHAVFRGGDFGGDVAPKGLGAVRGFQFYHGHAMVSYRSLLLRYAPVFLLVLPVHERTHGEWHCFFLCFGRRLFLFWAHHAC